MEHIMLILGVIILAGGIALRYWINRRRFYRRNFAGVEEFSSYEESVFVRFLERMGKWIAYALIVFGVLFLCVPSSSKKEKEARKEAEKFEKKS